MNGQYENDLAAQQNYNSRGTYTDNTAFNNASSLNIKLNTEPILKEFEAILRGQELYEEIINGEVVVKSRTIGQPLANDKGIQALMFFIKSIFNQHIVQGNFKEDVDYENYIIRRRKDLACLLTINRSTYGISLSNQPVVIYSFMAGIEAFMTRPLDNKEREGNNMAIKSSEIIQTGQTNNKKFLGVF